MRRRLTSHRASKANAVGAGSWPTASLTALTAVRVGPWSTSGPQIANHGLSAWESDCHVSLTTAPQVRWHLGLSVGTRQVPLFPLLSGTQRARARGRGWHARLRRR